MKAFLGQLDHREVEVIKQNARKTTVESRNYLDLVNDQSFLFLFLLLHKQSI